MSYLNTKPLLFGWKNGYAIEGATLVEDYPAKVAEMLLNDEIDLGLVPVAVIPKLKEHFIISDYCISAVGEVASVCLFSHVPLDKIENVLLDYQSRTSVALVKILMKEHWKIEPQLFPANENFIEEIKGTTAAVVIGDRAFELRNKLPFVYDLALAWKDFTGLPFVFAAWVANKPLPEDFIEQFNRSNSIGLQQLEAVVAENSSPDYDLMKYYTENISYELDESKRQGLELFLSKITDA